MQGQHIALNLGMPLHEATRTVVARCNRTTGFNQQDLRFLYNQHMKVVMPFLFPGRFTHQVIFLVLISVRPQGHSAAGRNMPVRNLNDTIGNRTHDLTSCNAVPQTGAPPRVSAPVQIILKFKHGTVYPYCCLPIALRRLLPHTCPQSTYGLPI